jgi:hypothetical protein
VKVEKLQAIEHFVLNLTMPRAGTSYLSRVFEKSLGLKRWIVRHGGEPRPGVAYRDRYDNYDSAIDERIRLATLTGRYIETGYESIYIIERCLEILGDKRLRALCAVRHPLTNVASIVDVTRRDNVGVDLLASTEYGCLRPQEARWITTYRENWGLFERRLADYFEMHFRFFHIASMFSPRCTFVVPFTKLNDEAFLREMLTWVDPDWNGDLVKFSALKRQPDGTPEDVTVRLRRPMPEERKLWYQWFGSLKPVEQRNVEWLSEHLSNILGEPIP